MLSVRRLYNFIYKCRKFQTCFIQNITILALLLAKKKQKWGMTFWAGTSKETKANQKIWNYSSPNENRIQRVNYVRCVVLQVLQMSRDVTTLHLF